MNLLLPVDGSPEALTAVRHVLAMHRAGVSLQVVLVNVQASAHLYEMVLAHDVGVLDAASQAAGEHALQTAAALLLEAGVPVAQQVLRGDPAHVLIEACEMLGCDALVLTGRLPGLLGGGRLGAVAQAVLQHATVPVTVVPQALPDDDEPEAASDTEGLTAD